MLERCLTDLGFEVILLAQAYENKKNQQLLELESRARIERTKYTNGGHVDSAIGNIKKILLKLIMPKKFNRCISYGWAKKAKMILDVGEYKNISCVWSISGGYLDAPVLGGAISEKLNIPHVLELHDPIVSVDIHGNDEVQEKIFKECLTSSKRIIVNTESYAEHLISKYKLGLNSVSCIPQAYSGNTNYKKHNKTNFDGTKINVSYVGSLTGGRSLKFLTKLDKFLLEKVTLSLAGSGVGFNELITIIEEHELPLCFNYYGKISKDEADELISKSDVSIIIQPTENSLEVPGKLFSILSLGKPVLALIDPNSETASILRRSRLGYIIDINSDSSSFIENIVIRLFNDLVEHKINPDFNYISSFSEQTFRKSVAELVKNHVN